MHLLLSPFQRLAAAAREYQEKDYSTFRPGAYRHWLNKEWPIPCRDPQLRAQWPVPYCKAVKQHDFGVKKRRCNYCGEPGHDAHECQKICLICLGVRADCDPRICDVTDGW